MLRTTKGFLLIDALINVFVVASLSLLCFSLSKQLISHEEGFQKYKNRMNEHLVEIYNGFYECQGCALDESD